MTATPAHHAAIQAAGEALHNEAVRLTAGIPDLPRPDRPAATTFNLCLQVLARSLVAYGYEAAPNNHVAVIEAAQATARDNLHMFVGAAMSEMLAGGGQN